MSIFFHHGSIKSFIKSSPISTILVIINTIAFIATLIYPYITGTSLLDLGAVYYGAIYYEEYYRLLTAMFLHDGFFHFFFNILFGILIISAGLEKLIGSLRFFIVYFVSGLFSINRMNKFHDNWFLNALLTTSLMILRFLYERGAYDSINFSRHKLFRKSSVLSEFVERKKFKDFYDYVEYRRTKKTHYTTYLLLGSIANLILSVYFSLN